MQSLQNRWSVADLLSTFDEHLRDLRGLGEGTRSVYAGYVQQFLDAQAIDEVVDVVGLTSGDVIDFVTNAASYYKGSRTVGHVATSLRSFFRFLRVAGLRFDRLDDAVPTVQKRPSPLPQHLDADQLAQLASSLPSWSTPRGLRDGAIILCIAR